MGPFQGSFVTFICNLQKISQIHEQHNTFETASAASLPSEKIKIKESNQRLSTSNSELLPLKKSVKLCEKSFQTRSPNYKKTKEHQGFKSCRICHKRFRKKDLFKHKTEVHKEIGEIWKCELCNKFNFSEWDLMMHINYRHINKENFDKCKVCNPEGVEQVSNSKKCVKAFRAPMQEIQ